MSDPTPFLGVDRSLTGRFWAGPGPALDRAAQLLSQSAGVPPVLGAVLARLGVAPEDVPLFLEPRLRDLMPDPSTLKDMDRAATALAEAAIKRARIAIFADYDVDGGASAALILDWLRQLGHDATLYVPDRIDEGYGPNVPAMEDLARRHDLIVCVDCGTLSHDPIAAAKAAGARVLVLDHHLGGETLPEAEAVVNPNRQDEETELGYLCAAGVVFLALVAANRVLRDRGTGDVPDLMGMLDLVALATVADVAPLQGLNRALVRQGLKVMGQRARPGLRALADVAGMTSAPAAYHLGYVMGPRVNAGGRIGQADLGAQLLSTDDPDKAMRLAEDLDRLNKERRDIEAAVLEDAKAQAEARGLDGALVWAAGDGWHPGVVGIVASRLKEFADRPAVVIGFDGETGKGSGRSIAGIDLGAAVATATREGLLAKGGGHRMAAGLTVMKDQLESAMARLSALLERQGAAAGGAATLRIDTALQPGAATADLVAEIDRAGPFGAGASAPRFAFPEARVAFAKRVGNGHLSVTFTGAGPGRLPAILFNAFDSPLGPALEAHDGRPFHIAGRLEIDDWGGRRKAKLRIEDAAPAHSDPT